MITEHYTGTGTSPVKSVAEQSITGSATNIIAGLGVGMQSLTIPANNCCCNRSLYVCWFIWYG